MTAGWGGFAAWALVGALISVSVVGAASIGLFLLPVAIGAVVVVGRRTRVWPEVTGMLEGVAAASLLVALLNRDSTPCTTSDGDTVLQGSLPGRTSASCGGVDPLPWLLVGIALAVVGVAVYARARLRR